MGEGSSRSNPYFRTKQKMSRLETDSLADTFFWAKNFPKNVKCYVEKSFENFLDTKEFFGGHFVLEKNSKKIFQNFFEKVLKKCPEKNLFLSHFLNLLPMED